MLDKLTVVLTIKGRSEFTKRWLAYMESIQCRCKILIADGGDDEFLQTHLEDKKNYPNLNYDYVKYPYDKDLVIYYKKLCDITDKVSTPYILYADNDDFFVFEHVEKYINFLDNNPDYVTCGGESAALSIYSIKNKIINACTGNYFTIRYDKLPQYSVKSHSGVERVCEFFKHVESDRLWYIWYDIQRANEVKITHEYIKKYEFKDVVSFEIYKISSLLMLGKSKRFDSLFYIRQNGPSEVSSSLDKEANVIERFVNINAFKEIIDGLIFIDKSISLDEKRFINKAFALWLSEKAKIIYFSSESKIRVFMNSLYGGANNFIISHFITRNLYSLRNCISSKKVYFLRNKFIESYILLKK